MTIKRVLVALCLLFVAAPALASTIGGFTVPSDLTGLPGGGYQVTAPIYKTDSSHNLLNDPTVNTPTGYGYELTNIPVPSTTNRIVTGGPWADNEGGFCTEAIFGGADPLCQEAKFRTHADFSHMLPDDPVRNFGQPGSSHLHCFFGAGSTNAYSTFKTLRKHSLDSTAAGTDVNGTGYWYPCVVDQNPFGDGKNYAVTPDFIQIYYVGDPSRKRAHIPVGLRYVFGYNMDDGGAWLQSYLDAANAAYGSTRYKMSSVTGGTAGFVYTCVGATATNPAPNGGGPNDASVLVNPDGSDPYNGTCNGARVTGYISGTTLTVTSVITGTVPTNGAGVIKGVNGASVTSNTNPTSQLTGTAGGVGTYQINNSQTVGSAGSPATFEIAPDFYINVAGPDCWDGVNFWSPGGYKHVIPKIRDTLYGEDVCPTNYYEIPHIVLEIHFTQHGWADRQKWVLSSDLAKRTATGQGASVWPAGSTFHTDWLFGWDNQQMLKWEQNCLGVDGFQAHQCSTSIISSTEYLKGGIIGGEAGVTRSPQIDITPVGTYDQSVLLLIPPAWSGAMSGMHIHH